MLGSCCCSCPPNATPSPPHPAPDTLQLQARDAATALLHLALWHTDDLLRLLGGALQVHAEEVSDSSNGMP
ncbi:hypothetical protein [Streptomyces sp. NPDC059783]|uniref:hypothetical protein n=1 Tax=Streptomyces sp. NPDC059783 TaxID=3346944 RepID=UPI003666A772